MSFVFLGAGTFTASDLADYRVPGAWRKATRNMIMAAASVERALDGWQGFKDLPAQELGLVLGTNSGELETTADFLTTWSRMKMARPLLFQNSLHNATTGFVSIHFGLAGPSLTVSAAEHTPRESLASAQALLTEGMLSACVVTLVEAHAKLAQLIGRPAVEGACTIILSTQDFAQRQNLRPLLAEFALEEWGAPFEPRPGDSPLYSLEDSVFFRRALATSQAGRA